MIRYDKTLLPQLNFYEKLTKNIKLSKDDCFSFEL